MLYSEMIGSTSAAVLQKLLATFKWQEQSHGDMCHISGQLQCHTCYIKSNFVKLGRRVLLSENSALPLSNSRTVMYGIWTEIVQ